jgi:hypothetical protein
MPVHHALTPPKCGGLTILACGHCAMASFDMKDWMAAPPRAATTSPIGMLGWARARATPVPQHSAEKYGRRGTVPPALVGAPGAPPRVCKLGTPQLYGAADLIGGFPLTKTVNSLSCLA